MKRKYVSPKTPAAALTLLAGMVDQIEMSSTYSKRLLDLVHSEPAFVPGYYVPILSVQRLDSTRLEVPLAD